MVNAGFEKGQKDVIVSPPLGIMCVGAALKREGTEVALFDWSGEELDAGKRRSLEAFGPVVGTAPDQMPGSGVDREPTTSGA